MDKIAYIVGENFIYWNSIILTMAAVVAILVFLSIYIGKSGRALTAAAVIPCAVGASLVLSRLVHWYCRADSYESLRVALTDYSTGGYALMGVFAGCLLAACLVRVIRLTKNLPELLDAMCLAGGAGIAVGRLACLYNTADRGMVITSATELPWVYPVINAVSGQTEYRLATFMIQAIVTGVIFTGMLLFYICTRRKGKTADGDTCLLFLLLYGASQAVLDSTRYDSLFMRSNGFISIVQILGAVGVVLAVVFFSVRMVRCRGWNWMYLALWIPIAAALGGAGYMEYYVQRHGDLAAFAYSIMSGCLLLVIIITWVIWVLSRKEKKRKKGGKYLAGRKNTAPAPAI